MVAVRHRLSCRRLDRGRRIHFQLATYTAGQLVLPAGNRLWVLCVCAFPSDYWNVPKNMGLVFPRVNNPGGQTGSYMPFITYLGKSFIVTSVVCSWSHRVSSNLVLERIT